jgi:tetratricopeptide (TPR) repeat protein
MRLALLMLWSLSAAGQTTQEDLLRPSGAAEAIRLAERRVERSPQDPAGYVALAGAYLRRYRETGDLSLISRADAACAKARQIDANFYPALSLQPAVFNVQHRFAEAIPLARQAIQRSPGEAVNFGTLGDALLEIGDYDAAVEAYNTMARLRPDSGSYARIARLHELYGDVDGAIDAMTRSVAAASGADPEHRAWCHTRLAILLLEHGKLQAAAPHLNTALEVFPDYPYALTAYGRLRAAQGRIADAVTLYRRSADVAPRQETVALLVDALRARHQDEEARDAAEMMHAIGQLFRAADIPPDRAMVLFWCDSRENLPEALAHAQEAAEERRDIYTADALAWALFANDRLEEALSASNDALRLGTRDALLHFHRGMILHRLGRRNEAVDALRTALSINPQFHIRFAAEAQGLLHELEKSP